MGSRRFYLAVLLYLGPPHSATKPHCALRGTGSGFRPTQGAGTPAPHSRCVDRSRSGGLDPEGAHPASTSPHSPHTHAHPRPSRHPLGPLGPFSPRPWAGRTCVRWSRLDGVHGNGDHPRSAALHALSTRALHAPPPIPTGRPQGSRCAPPPAWQRCSAQAGKCGFRGYRPCTSHPPAPLPGCLPLPAER